MEKRNTAIQVTDGTDHETFIPSVHDTIDHIEEINHTVGIGSKVIDTLVVDQSMAGNNSTMQRPFWNFAERHSILSHQILEKTVEEEHLILMNLPSNHWS